MQQGHLQVVKDACQRAHAMIEQGVSRREVLTFLCTAAERTIGAGAVASILVLDENGLLRNGASPNLPADYLDAIDRLKPDANLGTCAAAAATGSVVVTASFMSDAKWAELRHLPLALGFAGAWSNPIKNGHGRVLGTFGMYHRGQGDPTPEEREVIEALSQVAARALAAEAVQPLPS